MEPALEITSGFTTLRLETLQSGIDSLVKACGDLEGTKSVKAPDVSEDGMVAYACALTDKIRKEKPSSAEASEAATAREPDPRLVEAQSVASLLGGGTEYDISDHEELSTAARQLQGVTSGNYMQPGALDDAIDEVAGSC